MPYAPRWPTTTCATRAARRALRSSSAAGRRWWRRWTAANAVTALVAHGQMNAHLLGEIDPSFGYEGWVAMTTPDVFEVWRDAGGVHFKRLWRKRDEHGRRLASFTTTLRDGKTGGFEIDLPFDANDAWGVKAPHHIAGTVSGVKVRGPLALEDGTYRLKLGPAWRRDCPFAPGDEVSVVLWPEGPQTEALPPDLLVALAGRTRRVRVLAGPRDVLPQGVPHVDQRRVTPPSAT